MTYCFKQFEYDKDVNNNSIYAPSLCFIFVGALDSSLKVHNYSVDSRKKMIIVDAVHEIGHGRGLNDLSGNADEHMIHYDAVENNCQYCVMNWPNAGDYQYIYPCFFCYKHEQYLKDSLSGKIIEGLYMSPTPKCY